MTSTRKTDKPKVAACDSLLPTVENIKNAACGVNGIGEVLVDSGVREDSEGSEPLTPVVRGCLEAGIIALAQFIEYEVETLERRVEQIEGVEHD